MKLAFLILLNKLITKVCKLFKRNGAQYPGYIIYDIFDKNILTKIHYPSIVIAVTGSSGKGTTCSIIKHILEENNYKVAFNQSGNNGVLGATTLILNNCDIKGNMKCDVLLLECDEKHLKLIFSKNKPTHLIITNITRDQPARNGSPEIIYNEISKAINNDVHLILNSDDPIVSRYKTKFKKYTTYGIDKINGDSKVQNLNNVDFAYCPICSRKLEYSYYHYGHLGDYKCPNNDFSRGIPDYVGSNVDLNNNTFEINKTKVKLNSASLYVAYAYLAAYTLCKSIGLNDSNIISSLNNALQKRGKTYMLKSRKLTMLESKNENNLSYLQSIKYIINQSGTKSIILGFENVSRRYKLNDLSWLYDVDFELLSKDKNIDKIFIIGRFRYDVATRLSYANIDKNKIVLVDDINNLIEIINKQSKGDIYTMVCFDMTQSIKEMVEKYEN